MPFKQALPIISGLGYTGKRKAFEKMVEEVIRNGVKNGEFRQDIDSGLICEAVFGICNWTLYWIDPNGPVNPAQIGGMYADILLNGIATKSNPG